MTEVFFTCLFRVWYCSKIDKSETEQNYIYTSLLTKNTVTLPRKQYLVFGDDEHWVADACIL